MSVYTIWPADKDGKPASSSAAWRQSTRWLVLDVTDGLDKARAIGGVVKREAALKHELALRVAARKNAGGQS